MYPLKSGQVFPFNHWYVAASSAEVSRELMARRILDIPIVLYRTEDGQPVASHDVCPHRRFPLSKSRLIGDSIQCNYHDFTFDRTGRCTHMPTGDRVPPSYNVRHFPLSNNGNGSGYGWAIRHLGMHPRSRTLNS